MTRKFMMLMALVTMIMGRSHAAGYVSGGLSWPYLASSFTPKPSNILSDTLASLGDLSRYNARANFGLGLALGDNMRLGAEVRYINLSTPYSLDKLSAYGICHVLLDLINPIKLLIGFGGGTHSRVLLGEDVRDHAFYIGRLGLEFSSEVIALSAFMSHEADASYILRGVYKNGVERLFNIMATFYY